MKELEKDMTQLRTGMKECGREVEFYRGQTLSTGDRYLPVMKEFMTTAQVRLTELEDLFTDMKARVSRLAMEWWSGMCPSLTAVQSSFADRGVETFLEFPTIAIQ